MKRVEHFLTLLLQLTMTFSLANSTAATCLDEQVASCRQAAVGGKMGEMAGGGECKPSAYVHYTHECRVQDYLPSIDFCCCELEAKVMCCRYHQDWDRFRCSEADDTIDQAQATNYQLPLPLEVFVPAVVGPVVFLACCIFCCTKCLCHRHYADEEDTDCFSCCTSKACSRCCSRCCSSCAKPSCSCCCYKDGESRSERHLEKSGAPSPDEHVPLTYPNLLHQHSHHSHGLSSQSSMEMSNGSNAKLLHMSSSSTGHRPEPSAPPPLLMDDVFLHSEYGIYGGSIASSGGGGGGNNNPTNGLNNPNGLSGLNGLNGLNNPSNINTMGCSDTSHSPPPSIPTYASPQHQLCASCSSAIIVPPPPPPPTYEESEGQRTNTSGVEST